VRERRREGEIVSKKMYSISFVVSSQTKTGIGRLKIPNVENEKYNTVDAAYWDHFGSDRN
jgi:hypothetical protein